MGTKIDYITTLKPLQVILKKDELSAEAKVQMAEEIIDAILTEAQSGASDK